MRFGFLFALCAWFIPFAAHADIYLLAQESLNGRPTTQTRHWFGSDMSARDDGRMRTVMRFDLDRMYLIDRAARTYRSLPVPEAAPPLSFTVAQTAEVARIGSRPARRWRVTGPATHGLRISLWMSTAIQRTDAFVDVMRKLARQPGAEWLAAYGQLDGFPLAQEISLTKDGMTQTRRSEVVTYRVMEAPGDTYLPPRGYKRVP